MQYDFDTVIDRKNTNSAKHDLGRKLGKPEDTIPLWVADMDFPAPPEVTAKIVSRASQGIFGYNLIPDGYGPAVIGWFHRRFGYKFDPKWLVTSPGVVFALGMAIRGLTAPGDAVLIQEPVYHPFSRLITTNGRRLVSNGLIYESGRYSIDLEDFEKKIVEEKVKLFILCSPHNPVGRVWSRGELEAMGKICQEHKCLVVADEIHADFVRPGQKHHLFASLSPEMAANSITCTAPSKTFNLAGLQASNIFIPDPAVRQKFVQEMNQSGYSELNTLGLTACQAAYEEGEQWLEQLKIYLESNLALLRQATNHIPGLKLVEPEGTYLAWLDFNGLGLSPDNLDHLVSQKARLWLDEGTKFGQAGAGFYRINLACPQATLIEALRRLNEAYAQFSEEMY